MVSAREGEAKLTSKERKNKVILTQGLPQTRRPRRERRIIALRGPNMSDQD